MSKNLKILLVVILFITAIKQDKICNHLGFGQANYHQAAISGQGKIKEAMETGITSQLDTFINDTIYRWDAYRLDWVVDMESNPVDCAVSEDSLSQPAVVQWELLEDIRYRLRYFSEIGAEIFAPIFGSAVESLHEREVIIEGYIIPLDGKSELLCLSFNPYASCFFCGNASPASILNLQLKEKGKRYEMDSYKKFKGTLHLNLDDPNQFYYILRDAVEL